MADDQFDLNPETDVVPSGFIKFPDEDKPQMLATGTFIGKEQRDNYNNDGKQWVYTILSKDGAILKLSGKPRVDDQMRVVKVGQVIGVYFRGLGDKVKGRHQAKLVDIVTKGTMNEEWLKEQEAKPKSIEYPAENEITADDIDF